ncbi:hypothetical protein Q3G72_003516 [Acer saccharum]|nr:hypothetical protein Q3G72_003516 [Acer saccharum]
MTSIGRPAPERQKPVAGRALDTSAPQLRLTTSATPAQQHSSSAFSRPTNIGLDLCAEAVGQKHKINESSVSGGCKSGKWRRVPQPNRAGLVEEKFGEKLGKRRSVELGIEEEAVELVGVNEIEDEKKIVQKLDKVVIHSRVPLASIKEGISKIFCWSKNFLVESLCNAQDKNKKIFDVPHLCSYWISPVLGKLKMNCVATFDRIRERTGIGVVIRDSDGEVLACCSQRMETNMSTKLANLLAIQKGIQFGVDYGFLLSVIKLDNAIVIDWINNGSHVDSKFGTILMEINKLTDGPQGLLF